MGNIGSPVKCRVYFNGIDFEVEALDRKGLRRSHSLLSNIVGVGGVTLGSVEVLKIHKGES
jgi:hypothetical protein